MGVEHFSHSICMTVVVRTHPRNRMVHRLSFDARSCDYCGGPMLWTPGPSGHRMRRDAEVCSPSCRNRRWSDRRSDALGIPRPVRRTQPPAIRRALEERDALEHTIAHIQAGGDLQPIQNPPE